MLWMVLALLCVRVLALKFSPYGLHGDEAQYWSWAQDLDWGYFSKPPMIAWIIASSTALFGDSEWAVRLASPILHCGAAILIYASGAKAFGPRSGFWAAAIYSLMPGVWVSSMIISTDAALLFFWALALYAWICLRQPQSKIALWRYTFLLGVALGLGLLSKYAMAFFIPPLLLAIWIDPPTRSALRGAKGFVLSAVAGLIITPNIFWNSANNFATLTHTAANTNLEGKTSFFHPLEFLSFLRDQFGVFGPVPFILLLGVLAFTLRRQSYPRTSELCTSTTSPPPSGRLLWMLAVFTLTPLLLISAQALLSRANANWAVSAYVSASLLLAYTAHISKADTRNTAALNTDTRNPDVRHSQAKWLARGLIMQSLFCSALLVVSLFPTAVDSLGLANSVKRLRAWPQTFAQVQTRFENGHSGKDFAAIVYDSRLVFYGAQYYGRHTPAPRYIWQLGSVPNNHAQLTAAFSKDILKGKAYDMKNQGPPVLFIQDYEGRTAQEVQSHFGRAISLPPITIDLGGGITRELKLWAAYDYKP